MNSISPSRIRWYSSATGSLTLSTMSTPPRCPRPRRRCPRSWRRRRRTPRRRSRSPTPAPFSMTTSWPWATSSCTPIGVIATRYSWFLTSLGTPIFITPTLAVRAASVPTSPRGRAVRTAMTTGASCTCWSRNAASSRGTGPTSSPCPPPRARARSRRGRPAEPAGQEVVDHSSVMPGELYAERGGSIAGPSPASSSSSRRRPPRAPRPRRRAALPAARPCAAGPGAGTGAGTAPGPRRRPPGRPPRRGARARRG